ncbi:hypothetical protein EYF80_057628 [Liparis tanakae]|uniref:RING-type domain-containing protein n=1 Tax=Liparis tanakae TaxID=230148 RepID=A0A4Z2EVD7_9TELE|nr:hypothetical protein EYF80_057628 [Liparis tanakae]
MERSPQISSTRLDESKEETSELPPGGPEDLATSHTILRHLMRRKKQAWLERSELCAPEAPCISVSKTPKMLECTHTFCLQCLTLLTNGRAGDDLSCPLCCRTELPPGRKEMGIKNDRIRRLEKPKQSAASQDGKFDPTRGGGGKSCSVNRTAMWKHM